MALAGSRSSPNAASWARICFSCTPLAWLRDVESRGASRVGTLLRPPAEAVTVRVRGGQTLRSDGPFAETKEHVAGVEIVECADLDDAIAIASAHPAAGRHPIEIRPFWPLEED